MGVGPSAASGRSRGRLPDHGAAASEALGHLQRLGFAVMNLQPIAGSDVGTIATVIDVADNADHAASVQKVQNDG